MVAKDMKDELFVFTCTLDYADVVETLQPPKARLGTCINSGASCHYYPDCKIFENYQTITTWDILQQMVTPSKQLG